jgi:hypothetical protein
VERPRFANDYPDDAALLALVDAFEAGNYKDVRSGTARILAAEHPEALKAAARDLRSRTEPGRMQIALLVIAAVLVIVLSGYEIMRHGPSAPSAPSQAPHPTIERIR